MKTLTVVVLASAALLGWGCAPPERMPTLELAVTPVTSSGPAPIHLRATAHSGSGKVGAGTAHFTSAAGNLVDGADFELDAFGEATATLVCDPGADVACGKPVRLAASWSDGKVPVDATAWLNVAGTGTGTGTGAGSGTETTGVPSTACGADQMVGTWARTDGFALLFGANGCDLTANGSTPGYLMKVTGTITAISASFPAVMTRTVRASGCVTQMFGSIVPSPPGVSFELVFNRSDGKCDLPVNFTETTVYTKR